MGELVEIADAERVDAIPAAAAARRGALPALILEDGRTLSYVELERRIGIAADSLSRCGVLPGDRVMLVGENTPDMIVLLFAAIRAGAWAVPINARLSAGEIDAIREHCGPRLIYFGSGSTDAAQHADLCGADLVALAGLDEGRVKRDAQAEADADQTSEPAERVAVMIYTSGSSGKPKGVMLTHRNLCYIANTSARTGAQRGSDRIYMVLPLSHSYGLTTVLLCGLRAGASLFPITRFSAESLARAVREQGLTVFQGVPAMYARLVEWAKASGASLTPNRLRLAYIGGSMIDPVRKAAAEELLGLRLHHGYGLTEAAPTVTRTLADAPPAGTSVGLPFPGVELCLLQEGGARVSATSGARGELLVRGPNVMKGYYRDAEQTRRAVDPEGWLHTGDQARVGSDGEIHILGRLKELIIHGGFNVYPAEVENAISAYPGVSQCAVVGVARDGDEEVIAFVEPESGADVDPGALRAFLRGRLAPYKIPVYFDVREHLPASATGKLLKATLQQLALKLRVAKGTPCRN
jgi:acyl-CoA synthetase (AMP-forming)/AMP-acid ligase II